MRLTAGQRRLREFVRRHFAHPDTADGQIDRAAVAFAAAAEALRDAIAKARDHGKRCGCLQCRDRQAREAVWGLCWMAATGAELLHMYGSINPDGFGDKFDAYWRWLNESANESAAT